MRMSRKRIFVAVLFLGCSVRGIAFATPAGSEAARRSLERCREAESSATDRREKLLLEGMRLAEEAIDVDEADPAAHFALFCNLGRRVKAAGLGLRGLVAVKRLRHEIDRAQELAPADPDVLTAKGAFLISLPRFLGGDADEGRRLLLQAFIADPENRATRLFLAQVED